MTLKYFIWDIFSISLQKKAYRNINGPSSSMLSLVKKASVVEANLERICDHFVRITKSIIKADDPTRMD